MRRLVLLQRTFELVEPAVPWRLQDVCSSGPGAVCVKYYYDFCLQLTLAEPLAG
jgi:hypothetical protein